MDYEISVLHILSNINKNGPAFVVNDLAMGLKKNNVQVTIASSGGLLGEDLEREGIKTYNIPIYRSKKSKISYSHRYAINFLKSIYLLIRIIKDNKINIIHAHQPIPIFLGLIVSKISKIPLVTTAHNIYNPRSLKDKMYTKGIRIVAVSDRVRKHLLEDFKVNTEKVVTVQNGINLLRINSTKDRELLSIRSEYNIDTDTIIVGVIAGLRKQKALDDLIMAASIVCKKLRNVKFIIVGEGELKEQLTSLVMRLGLEEDIIFTGFRDDVYDILTQIDIFCLSSIYEGLPISLLEALGKKSVPL